MEFLGIGPLELLLIVTLALIVLGPKDMVKAGRSIGRFLRTVVSSDTWRVVQQASREMRNLPNRLMREAGIEELEKQLPSQRQLSEQMGLDELKQGISIKSDKTLSAWTTPPSKGSLAETETIAPPRGGAQPAEGDPIQAGDTAGGTVNNEPASASEADGTDSGAVYGSAVNGGIDDGSATEDSGAEGGGAESGEDTPQNQPV